MTGSPSYVDPIFAAIERHRRTWEELTPCSGLDAAASKGDKEAAQKLDRLWNAHGAATDKLRDITPTTVAGVAAVLAYAVDHATSNASELSDWAKRVSWEAVLHEAAN